MLTKEWKWSDMAEDIIDPGRLSRAEKVKVSHLDISETNCCGTFFGSKGNIYLATLDSCDCPDFAIKHGTIPCKHILRLAMEAGIINRNGRTPEQQNQSDLNNLRYKLANAYGFYYLLDDPIISDAEYDMLKKQLYELQPRKDNVKPAQSVLYDSVIKYLSDNGLDYIDKTSSGGSLYFFNEQAAMQFKEKGYAVRYAPAGTKSTSGKAAWYITFK